MPSRSLRLRRRKVASCRFDKVPVGDRFRVAPRENGMVQLDLEANLEEDDQELYVFCYMSPPSAAMPPSENKLESRHIFHSIPKGVHQHNFTAPVSESVTYVAHPMKPEPPPARIVRVYSSASAQQPMDFALKETSPFLGGGQIADGVIRSEKPAKTYDLVGQALLILRT